jgi:hypothetical protein
MPIKLFKLVLSLLAMIISPMIIAAIASAVFIAIHLANGESFSAAMQSLTIVFENLLPFLPYITGIPAVLIVVTVIITKRNRIQSWFRK